ncbi:DUF4861 family protein [Caulobacter sp. 73W]|uniref:DUF4861 family protein n=1 Tax=Caulobacter sp. 73W TaxID=3161137 RepID=A0AB39KTA7_9CAUL
MKPRVRSLIAASILASGLVIAPAGWAADAAWYTQGQFAPVERIEIKLTNDLNEARRAAPVVLTPEHLPMLRGAQALTITLVDPTGAPRPAPDKERQAQEGPHGHLAESGGRAIDYQLDDLDADGLWDELFLQVDLKPRETRTIHIYRGFQQRGWNPHRTHAGIGSYMRHTVPFWESEAVGWKLWFPTDADVYGKREPLLMSPRLYMGNLDGYAVSRIDPAMGSDIMSVDDSFGGGGIGVFDQPSQPDVVSRPRFTPNSDHENRFNGDGLSDTRYAFEVVANGPLRSMIRVKTLNWDSGHGRYEVEQLYTAYAGQNYSTARVRFKTFAPRAKGAAFAAGIRAHDPEEIKYQAGGVVITGGAENVRNPDDKEAVQNSFRIEYAGSALIVRDQYKPAYVWSKARQGNHVFRVEPTKDGVFEYMLAAAWSEGPTLKTADAFRGYVIKSTREYNAPVRLTGIAQQSR